MYFRFCTELEISLFISFMVQCELIANVWLQSRSLCWLLPGSVLKNILLLVFKKLMHGQLPILLAIEFHVTGYIIIFPTGIPVNSCLIMICACILRYNRALFLWFV